MFSFSSPISRMVPLVLLAVGSWMAIIADFDEKLVWQTPPEHRFPAIQFSPYEFGIAHYRGGILISGTSDELQLINPNCKEERLRCADNTLTKEALLTEEKPPLLNLQFPDGKVNIEQLLEKKIQRSVFGKQSFSVSHLIVDTARQLSVSARLIGHIQNRVCNAQARCIIITLTPDREGRSAFYSEDGGRQWRWLSHFTMPGAKGNISASFAKLRLQDDGRLFGMTDNRLYVTDDLGQNWQQLVDLNILLPKNDIDITNDIDRPYSWPESGNIEWAVTKSRQMYLWLKITSYHPSSNEDGYYLTNQTLRISVDTIANKISEIRWINGVVTNVETSAEGKTYLIFNKQPEDHYSLNELNSDGSFKAVFEIGHKELRQLYVGNHFFMMRVDTGQRIHHLVSTDDAKNWRRIGEINYQGRMLFDPENNRFIGFYPTYGKAVGNKFGLAYEEVGFK